MTTHDELDHFAAPDQDVITGLTGAKSLDDITKYQLMYNGRFYRNISKLIKTSDDGTLCARCSLDESVGILSERSHLKIELEEVFFTGNRKRCSDLVSSGSRCFRFYTDIDGYSAERSSSKHMWKVYFISEKCPQHDAERLVAQFIDGITTLREISLPPRLSRFYGGAKYCIIADVEGCPSDRTNTGCQIIVTDGEQILIYCTSDVSYAERNEKIPAALKQLLECEQCFVVGCDAGKDEKDFAGLGIRIKNSYDTQRQLDGQSLRSCMLRLMNICIEKHKLGCIPKIRQAMIYYPLSHRESDKSVMKLPFKCTELLAFLKLINDKERETNLSLKYGTRFIIEYCCCDLVSTSLVFSALFSRKVRSLLDGFDRIHGNHNADDLLQTKMFTSKVKVRRADSRIIIEAGSYCKLFSMMC